MMRRWYSAVLMAALTSAGLMSCAGSPPSRSKGHGLLPVADAQATQAAGLSITQAEQAQKLFTAKCMRCHKSYDPRAYPDPQWQNWMSKMSRKAHLDSQQRELLVRYLQAVRATPTPARKTE